MDYLVGFWKKTRSLLFNREPQIITQENKKEIDESVQPFRVNRNHQPLMIDLKASSKEKDVQRQLQNEIDEISSRISKSSKRSKEESPDAFNLEKFERDLNLNIHVVGQSEHKNDQIQSVVKIYESILEDTSEMLTLLPQIQLTFPTTQPLIETAIQRLNKDISYFQSSQLKQDAFSYLHKLTLKLYNYQTQHPILQPQQLSDILYIYKNLANCPDQVMRSSPVNEISYKNFCSLNKSKWLNDEVINTYLDMIKRELPSEEPQYNIMNTFFAVKLNQSNMQRFISKFKINSSQKLIIPVHWNNNHWMFVTIVQGRISLYDSLKVQDVPQILFELAKRVYGKKVEFEVMDGFPKQKGFEDCGVFMLCGIKAICLGFPCWGFGKETIQYKRVMIARDILRGKMGRIRASLVELRQVKENREVVTQDESD